MKYDFTSIMDRMGKDAIAVEALGQIQWHQSHQKKDLMLFRCGLQI